MNTSDASVQRIETITGATVWTKSEESYQQMNNLGHVGSLDYGSTVYEAPVTAEQLQNFVKRGLKLVYSYYDLKQDSQGDTIYYDEESGNALATKFCLTKHLEATARPRAGVSLTGVSAPVALETIL